MMGQQETVAGSVSRRILLIIAVGALMVVMAALPGTAFAAQGSGGHHVANPCLGQNNLTCSISGGGSDKGGGGGIHISGTTNDGVSLNGALAGGGHTSPSGDLISGGGGGGGCTTDPTGVRSCEGGGGSR